MAVPPMAGFGRTQGFTLTAHPDLQDQNATLRHKRRFLLMHWRSDTVDGLTESVSKRPQSEFGASGLSPSDHLSSHQGAADVPSGNCLNRPPNTIGSPLYPRALKSM